MTKKNELSPNIVVKKLRLIPLEFESGRRKHICLRMEVYGCPVEEEIGKLFTYSCLRLLLGDLTVVIRMSL